MRLSLLLGAVVSVTGCVHEDNFRKHLYFPWPCTMIRPRRMRDLRVVCSTPTRADSRRGEQRHDQMSEVLRSSTRAVTRGTRYAVEPLYAIKP
ncbi:MAG: hypothetical protein ACYTFI_14200, partial [Planctomycetota bacterium]